MPFIYTTAKIIFEFLFSTCVPTVFTIPYAADVVIGMWHLYFVNLVSQIFAKMRFVYTAGKILHEFSVLSLRLNSSYHFLWKFVVINILWYSYIVNLVSQIPPKMFLFKFQANNFLSLLFSVCVPPAFTSLYDAFVVIVILWYS